MASRASCAGGGMEPGFVEAFAWDMPSHRRELSKFRAESSFNGVFCQYPAIALLGLCRTRTRLTGLLLQVNLASGLEFLRQVFHITIWGRLEVGFVVVCGFTRTANVGQIAQVGRNRRAFVCGQVPRAWRGRP